LAAGRPSSRRPYGRSPFRFLARLHTYTSVSKGLLTHLSHKFQRSNSTKLWKEPQALPRTVHSIALPGNVHDEEQAWRLENDQILAKSPNLYQQRILYHRVSMAPSSVQYAENAAQAFFGILSCTLTVQFDNEPATRHLNNLKIDTSTPAKVRRPRLSLPYDRWR
jgi:hypothetical protein